MWMKAAFLAAMNPRSFSHMSDRPHAFQGDPPHGNTLGGTTFGVPPYAISAWCLRREALDARGHAIGDRGGRATARDSEARATAGAVVGMGWNMSLAR